MDSKTIVALAMLLAVGAAGYLWYAGLPGSDGGADDPSATSSPAEERAASVPAEEIEAGITGTWRSADDPSFTREFRADGSVIDRYEGDGGATVRGSWQAVTGAGLPASLAGETRTVLRLSFPEEAQFFIVTELDAEDLALLYASGSGTLRFERAAP